MHTCIPFPWSFIAAFVMWVCLFLNLPFKMSQTHFTFIAIPQFWVTALTDECACFAHLFCLTLSFSLFLIKNSFSVAWPKRSLPQMRNRLKLPPRKRRRERERELRAVWARACIGTAARQQPVPPRADISLTDVTSERGTSVTRQSDNHHPQHGHSPGTRGTVCAGNDNESLLRGRWGQWSVQSSGIQFGF